MVLIENVEAGNWDFNWSYPIESLLISSLGGPDSSVSIITEEDWKLRNQEIKLTTNRFMFRRWDIRNDTTLSELFSTSTQNITTHLKNIYDDAELKEVATCKEILQVQLEGTREVSRKTKFYNLDAIISVGYRINSSKATQFRIWATQTLKMPLQFM